MQILLNGFIHGLLIAVLAVGFHAVFLPRRIFYIALAGIYAAAPYLLLQSACFRWPTWLNILVTLLACVALSISCDVLNHRWLERAGASSAAHLVASLGLFIVLTEGIALIWGNETRTLRTGVDATIRVRDLILTRAQITGAIASFAVLVVFAAFLRFSRLGLQFRALADNPVQLALMRYNTEWLRLIGFGIAGAFAGAASLLMAYDIGFDPHRGLHALLLAVVAVIIGGSNTYCGPMLGGVLLGLTRAGVIWLLSARWQEAATFALLVVILFLRPQGLFGEKRRLEADG